MNFLNSLAARWARIFTSLIDPETPSDGPPPEQLYPFFGWALRGSWGLIAITGLAMIIASALEVWSYYLLARIVDLAEIANPSSLWLDHASLLIWFVVLSIVLRPIAFCFSASLNAIAMGPGLSNLVISRINNHVMGHSIQFFDDDFAGRIAQKEMQTTRALVEVIQELIHAILFALTMVVGTAALFGAMSGILLVLMAIWFVFYVIFLSVFLPRLRARSQVRAAKRASVTGQIVDTVTNMRTVKLFAGIDHEERSIFATLRKYRTASVEWATLAAFFRVGLIFLGGLLPVMMLGYGLVLWQGGGISAGDLAAIGALSLRLSQMSGWVSWTLLGMFSNLGEIEDGIRTLAPSHQLVDKKDASDLELQQPKLRFDNVEFRYGSDIGGVTAINLDIKPGEKIGLVGPSGAGKSTLLSLVLRLYDPEKGEIRISDQDIRGVTQNSLRENIAMVTQDAAMFNRSARDNILYGRPNADEEELIAAAQKAESFEFIQDLVDPKGRKGMNAFLGERGVKLSGGQRQRIALARAILKDAPILLLDEATSALDSEVEAQIQNALTHVMAGKTVIAIAHRLSTIARMDRIVVMDQGRIVEQGSHDDLIASKGVYAKLWQRQTGDFLNIQ